MYIYNVHYMLHFTIHLQDSTSSNVNDLTFLRLQYVYEYTQIRTGRRDRERECFIVSHTTSNGYFKTLLATNSYNNTNSSSSRKKTIITGLCAEQACSVSLDFDICHLLNESSLALALLYRIHIKMRCFGFLSTHLVCKLQVMWLCG